MADVYNVLPQVNISFSGKRLFAGKSDELTVETEKEKACLDSLFEQEKLVDITDGQKVRDEVIKNSDESGESQESEEIDLDALNLDQLKALADQEKIEYGTTIGEDTLRQRIFEHFESEDGE